MGNKGVVRTWGLHNILKKSDKKKEEEFRYLGVANCRKANIMGKLTEYNGYFSKICQVDYYSGADKESRALSGDYEYSCPSQ